VGAAVALVLWGTGSATAELPVGQARKAADRVDERIGQMQVDLRRAAESVGVGMASSGASLDRRLADADVQALLEDYWRAAVLLLDAVEDPRNRSHPRYREAEFKLAEALRLSRNFRSAQRYYQRLLYESQGERLSQVVEGLLDIATKTETFDGVDQYISRLREAGSLSRPDVDYLHGKTLFLLGRGNPARLAEALNLFRRVPQTSLAGPKASYFAGVTLVRMERYPDAVAQFQSTLALTADDPSQSELSQLTQLSLGRLLQEVGQTEASADAYASIPESSPYFSDMLFEVAWTHVKQSYRESEDQPRREALQRALAATELLMATAPEPKLFARARILQGNLQIRLGAPETAYEAFESVIDRYTASRRELDRFVQTRDDTQAFFDEIIRATLEGEDPGGGGLPQLAVDFVLEERSMDRILTLERDLADTRQNLEESQELIEVLEQALSGEARFGMFPGLEAVRDSSLSIHNRWLTTELELLELEREAVVPRLNAAAVAEVDAAHGTVVRLADEIRGLPQSARAVAQQRTQLQSEFEEANLQAYRLTYRVSAMRSELQAVTTWLSQNRSQLSEAEIDVVEDRIERTKRTVEGLEDRLEVLLREIRGASVVGAADAGTTRATELADRFVQARDSELGVLSRGRGAASTDMVGVLARFDQQRRTLAGIRQDLQRLDGQVRSRVDDQLGATRQQLAQETVRVEEAARLYAEVERTSGGVLQPVTERTLAAVQGKFDQLVLEADVGIIDVAWARKQAETRRVTEVVQQMQTQTQALEAEFADVLEE
jgi:tetratricopeptide (TPR) repeat protein